MDVVTEEQPRHPVYQSPQPQTVPIDQSEEDIPLRLRVAMNFVAHCNSQMGWANFIAADQEGVIGAEIKERQIPAAQEAAFNLACMLIGDYFSGKDPESHGRQSREFANGGGSETAPDGEVDPEEDSGRGCS
jgi:hypothetical protein